MFKRQIKFAEWKKCIENVALYKRWWRNNSKYIWSRREDRVIGCWRVYKWERFSPINIEKSFKIVRRLLKSEYYDRVLEKDGSFQKQTHKD